MIPEYSKFQRSTFSRANELERHSDEGPKGVMEQVLQECVSTAVSELIFSPFSPR